MKATRRRRLLGHAVALGVAYAGLSAMVTAITSLGATTGATFWPGAGLTVAVLLVCPRREWPALLAAVAIAELAMDLVLGYGLGLAVSWALVNTAEPAVAAWLLRRGGRAAPDLSRLPDLARFVAFAVLAAPLLGALVGTTAGVIVTGDAWWPRLPQWWVGDGIGALVVAPLLLLALTGRWHLPRPKQTWPLALLVATAGIALGPWEFPGTIGLPFLVLPVLGLVALRLRTPGAAVGVLFVATLVVVGTALGTGPFAQSDALHGLVVAQMFLAMNALAALSVAAVMTDLGSRDELERGLRRYNEALLNSAGDGICGLSVQGSVTFANPAALRLTGHDIDGLRGCDLHATLQHSRPDGTPYASQDSPILASLCDAAVHRCDRDVFWRTDRTSFPVEYTSTPLLEDGTTTGAVVIFKDISERREVERVKDELTSVVSHELRTPLASIRGSLGLVQSGALRASPEKAQRMIEIAVQNTDRVVRLIDDILDVERIGSGTIRMNTASCDAAQLVEQAAGGLASMADEAHVTLVTRTQPVAIVADADRILQTLTNLIGNAIKFSEAGTSVGIAVQARDGEVRFDVRDEGRGIPPDKLETIFGRFEQVDSSDSRDKGGTGLGLTICRSIVELHGGRIWAHSPPGTGATVSFTLPA